MPIRKEMMGFVIASVDRAIDNRLLALHTLCGKLQLDMESAIDIIATRRRRANLADIAVGAYHRYQTELGALQWFSEQTDPLMSVDEMTRIVDSALLSNIRVMKQQRHRVGDAMALALEHIVNDDDDTFDDLRTASWYKASTESRVYKWLSDALHHVAAGEPFEEFDKDGFDTENL